MGSPATYSIISKPGFFGVGTVVDVAQINEDLAAEQAGDAVEVERPELVPFGDNDQDIGALGCRIGVLGELDAGEDLLRLLAGDGIERGNARLRARSGFDDRDRGRLAHVVGVRLEREAKDRRPAYREARRQAPRATRSTICALRSSLTLTVVRTIRWSTPGFSAV